MTILLKNKKARVRIAHPSDVDKIARLEIRAWGALKAANKDQILSRIKVFPEGNFVVVVGDIVVGYASFILIDYDEYTDNSWYSLTANGYCTNHDHNGKDLFGITLSVPRGAPSTTSLMLTFEAIKMAIRRNVKRGILGSRVPRYHKYAESMSIEEYVAARRASGSLLDPELEFYRRKGLKIVEIIPNYFKDPESLNYGVIVEMKIPFYDRPFLGGAARLMTHFPINPVSFVGKYSKLL